MCSGPMCSLSDCRVSVSSVVCCASKRANYVVVMLLELTSVIDSMIYCSLMTSLSHDDYRTLFCGKLRSSLRVRAGFSSLPRTATNRHVHAHSNVFSGWCEEKRFSRTSCVTDCTWRICYVIICHMSALTCKRSNYAPLNYCLMEVERAAR